MPIKHAGKKAQRASKTNRVANEKQKESLKAILKKATAANLNIVFKAIDKATKKHLLHPNKANRMKSQFSKKFATSTPAKVAKQTVKPVKATKKVAKSKSVKKTKK